MCSPVIINVNKCVFAIYLLYFRFSVTYVAIATLHQSYTAKKEPAPLRGAALIAFACFSAGRGPASVSVSPVLRHCRG